MADEKKPKDMVISYAVGTNFDGSSAQVLAALKDGYRVVSVTQTASTTSHHVVVTVVLTNTI